MLNSRQDSVETCSGPKQICAFHLDFSGLGAPMVLLVHHIVSHICLFRMMDITWSKPAISS
jgi:hypothetical protein